MNSCKDCSGDSGHNNSSENYEQSISNDSLAYIMGELVGLGYHDVYLDFKYHGESINLDKVAEEFDNANSLCANKGFLDGLLIYFFTQQTGQMFYENKEFDISPSELRKYTLKFLEDSTNFKSREDLINNKSLITECINNKDTASIYEIFGGYIACYTSEIMKKENNIFIDCKKEILKGISYSEDMRDRQPAIDGFCKYIAIEVVMYLRTMIIETDFSSHIAANACKKTLLNGSVKSLTEKEQLWNGILKEYDGIDSKLLILPPI